MCTRVRHAREQYSRSGRRIDWLPKAYVVRRSDVTANEVIAFVAERVAPYKKVRAVEFIEQIPKSASGKILRRALIQRASQRMQKR